MLLDCYQALLTERQQQMMDLYYNQDFSLAEIAETMGISRQGVYDHIKRTEKLLTQYEQKMNLLETFKRQNQLILQTKDLLVKLEQELAEPSPSDKIMDTTRSIKNNVEKLYRISIS